MSTLALLRTVYLLAVAALSALFMTALILNIRRRWRQRRIRRILDEFGCNFHMTLEEKLLYIGKERAKQLVIDELRDRGVTVPPGHE